MSSQDNENKNAENMSLEELLGHKGGTPTDDYDDLDDDQKRNEAGSGLINLSALVGDGMLDNKPHQPAPQADLYGQQNFQTGTNPMAPANMQPMADIAPQNKKSSLPVIIAIAAVLIIGVGAAAFFMISSNNNAAEEQSMAMKKLEDELAEMSRKAEIAQSDEAKQELQKQIDAKKAEIAASEGSENGNAEEAANDEESMEFDENETAGAKGAAGGKKIVKRKTATSKNTPATASSTTTTPNTTAKTESKTTVPATEKKSDVKTSVLDSMLSGSGTVKTGGLPEQPSRAEVTKAMNQVSAKARSVCSASGSGTVSVRIIVGSNGKVRDAVPTGEHAADSLGRCVSNIARGTGRFPQFTKPTFTFTYPVKI
ncbi:MAG: hypothetical protein JXR91_10620 [Deltaproteobacteria bacterium]|nr:hypothetical protein [Deltaproteobacteria bacterium]